MGEHSAMDRTVGLDVGDRETHFCILDEAGEILEEGRFRSTRAGLAGRFRNMPSARRARGRSPLTLDEPRSRGLRP